MCRRGGDIVVTVIGKSKITDMFVLGSGMKSWMEGSLKEIWKVGRDGAVRVSAFRETFWLVEWRSIYLVYSGVH
jgi:hypothetical protein